MDVPRPQRRRRLARAGLLVAIAAGAVTTAAFGFVRASNTTASVSRRDVRVETVRRGPLVREVQARGTLVPDQVQWVTAAGPARVARIDVAPGASVTAGHSLVVLENAELELAALDAERAASSARADVAALLGRSQVELLESDATRAAMETELSALQSRAQTTAALAREGLAPAADARELDVRTRGARTRVDMERSRRALVDRGARDELAARTEAELWTLESAALESAFGSELERTIVAAERTKGVTCVAGGRIRQEYVRRYAEHRRPAKRHVAVAS